VITALPRIAIAARDFDGIVRTFRDALGMPVVDLSAWSAAKLGAKLAMCVPPGGSNIELMSPAGDDAPLAKSLARSLARRGDGLFALMVEAPDPDAEAEAFAERGLPVLPLMAGAGGRDVHPRGTHGVLIRVYPSRSFEAAPEQVQRSATRALGLSGIARVAIAVRDAKRARDVYAGGLGLAASGPVADARRGVVAATCAAPEGAAIELLEPSDPSRPFAAALERRLGEAGEGMFALVLRTPDPAAAARALAQRGLCVTPCAGEAGVVEIDPASLYGARVLIEPAPSA
jgi:catechol 2,3-dioxygenase-like lactoylglutathione lyase family enzyme